MSFVKPVEYHVEAAECGWTGCVIIMQVGVRTSRGGPI
jgi:hypothetical protein